MNTPSIASTTVALPEQVPLPRTGTARPLRWGIAGIGPALDGAGLHIARHLAALGAQVTALTETRPDSLQAAQQELRGWGLSPRAYADFEDMLDHESLDAVAICSPANTHRGQLRTALDHGVHVLCEKPLLLESGRDPVADARPLLQGFGAAGKSLRLIEPWPYTLRYFDELYPEARIFHCPPQHLAMLLCPAVSGFEMITCAVPHALSLLFALCPSRGAVERVRVQANDTRDDLPTALTISFQYLHSGGRTNVSIDLCQMSQSPRPAGYNIDGRSVRRVVQMPGYQTFFAASDATTTRTTGGRGDRPVRRVPINDPLRLLLADFQQHTEHPSSTRADDTLLERLSLLRTIYAVARTSYVPSP